jgi:hypothetical protein
LFDSSGGGNSFGIRTLGQESLLKNASKSATSGCHQQEHALGENVTQTNVR